jgi:hypothetical protein
MSFVRSGFSTGGRWLSGRVAGWGRVSGMGIQLPAEALELLEGQGMVIARNQCDLAGIRPEDMDNALRTGRWKITNRGVYQAFTGELTRLAELHSALLRAGEGAVLSHWTEAERHGLLKNPSQSIHITVPTPRNPVKHGTISGIVIHRSDSILRTRHPAMTPACTRIEDTVLDLIEVAPTFDVGYMWLARAIGGRQTTGDRIRKALDQRRRFRWRREVELALGDAADGAHSWLERRYIRQVERPHGIPPASRQVRVRRGGRNTYLDNLYAEYGVCVELDGAVAHPAAEQWRDKRRDNVNLADEIETFRFGYLDLHDRTHQCATAALVSRKLRAHGLPAAITHPCGPTCPVPG